MTRSRIYTTTQLQVVIDEMADQVAAGIQPGRPLVVIGILRRGAPQANGLAESLVRRHAVRPPDEGRPLSIPQATTGVRIR